MRHLMMMVISLVMALGFEASLMARDVNSAPTTSAPGYSGVQVTAQESEKQPQGLEDRVTVTERFNEQVPLDLVFKDHRGREVTLGECLRGDKAVLLNLVYYNCPSICNELMNGVVEAMRQLPWKVGDEFQVLTISIDARETPSLSSRKRVSYVGLLGQNPSHEDWRFLTGSKEDIQILADSVGYGFAYQKEIDQFAHPSVTILLSPQGRVMRYLEGMYISPMDLKLGLVEAGQGQVGNPIDKALLRWCYAYDPRARGYSMKVRKLMLGGGAMTVLVVGGFMFFMWRREVREGGLK